jgi:DNA-directed RNA polymerase subunit RPC12/RpoP
MATRSFICPHCGATLSIEQGKRKAVCEYCDSEILIPGVAEEPVREEVRREPEQDNHRETAYSYVGQNGGPQRGTVYTQNYSASGVSPKSRLVALLLLIFLGIFGVHRFYVGKIGTGLLYFFTVGLFGIGYCVDLILIVIGSFRDSRGLPLLNWQ